MVVGYYAAIGDDDLEGLRKDSSDIETFIAGLIRDEDRCLDVDKAWAGIDYLLNGEGSEGPGLPVDIVFGGEALGEEDVGRGPARFLSKEMVKTAASALGALDFSELRAAFNAGALGNPAVYPGFEDEEDFNYLEYNFMKLQGFLRRSAEAGLNVLLFIA